MDKTKRWARFRYMPCQPLGADGRAVTSSETHIALARRAAAEGMVLLKNDGVLPLAPGSRIAVFGKAQADFVKGGGGSGDVTVSRVKSLLDGLEEKQAQGKLRIFAPLSKFYRENVEQQYQHGILPGKTTEPPLPESLLQSAAAWTDTAFFTICRYSREEFDRADEPGDYRLSSGEAALLDAVCRHFPKVVVILNIGGPIAPGDFSNRANGILLMWQPGMEGGGAAADILCGDAYPSGKLTDTFAYSYQDYPSAQSFGTMKNYETYTEDIFVGYRYFETIPGAASTVCWPFGFGLGYTSFELTAPRLEINGGFLTVTVSVTNTGSHAGREVVQVYCQPPQGKLATPTRVLCGFQKTQELAPGATETVCVSFLSQSFASYDDTGAFQKSAWLLQGGDYRFYVGTSVRDTVSLTEVYSVEESFRVLEQLSPRCTPNGLDCRLQPDGSYAKVPNFDPAQIQSPVDPLLSEEQEYKIPGECPWQPAWLNATYPTLDQVASGALSLEQFVAQLSVPQLVHLLGGQPNRGIANTFGIGNLEMYGIPNIMTADGPAGLRVEPQVGVYTTAFPCATLLACTWDPELVAQVGAAGAEEVLENGIGIWLTPAVNIHRNPLCGRNFEYYAEDPLVAGTMAAAMVRGIQSRGIAASLKHFAANNREQNRKECDARVSERALREIYLRCFEICVKEAHPWTIMSSYNPVNGIRTSENRDLLTGILREEWGYTGLVITDWWNHGTHWRELLAGNDVRMPAGAPEQLQMALEQGLISEEEIRQSARRVLQLILRLAAI